MTDIQFYERTPQSNHSNKSKLVQFPQQNVKENN